jgi:hypothetical protein
VNSKINTEINPFGNNSSQPGSASNNPQSNNINNKILAPRYSKEGIIPSKVNNFVQV